MTSDILYDREVLTVGLFSELRPLFDAHYAELAPEGQPHEPSIDPYLKLQAVGFLRLYTARQSRDHKLVGYAVFIVAPNPQYGGAVHAKQDLMFLSKDYRKGMAGYNFMRWCDDRMKAEGVRFVLRHLDLKNDHASVLERMGYKLHEKVYARRFQSCVPD